MGEVVWVPLFPMPLSMPEMQKSAVFPPSEGTTAQHGQKVANAVDAPTQEFTTLMLRNLPNSYTRNMLIELLDKEGLHGDYDLVYVPVDFTKLAGLGYAFV